MLSPVTHVITDEKPSRLLITELLYTALVSNDVIMINYWSLKI